MADRPPPPRRQRFGGVGSANQRFGGVLPHHAANGLADRGGEIFPTLAYPPPRRQRFGGLAPAKPGRPGGCPPGLPQIRTCPIKASGSSIRGFALRPRDPEELHAQGFESRCTRPVSRLRDRGQAPPWLRRVPVGPVPRLHSYYEVLRTPTALSAGLRFLRPAVTTFAPVFVPLRPDAGRWAWSCCVAAPTTWRWRRSGLPGSWGTLMCLCPGL